MRSEHEHRGVDSPIPEGSEHLHAVHAGQPKVQHDHVILTARPSFQPLGAVINQIDVHSLFLETALDETPYGEVVFDNENLHDSSTGPSATGKNTRKVEPRPGCESTTIRPRCC